MTRRVIMGFVVVFILALTACGSSQGNTTAGAGAVAQGTPGGFFGGGEMGLSMQLPAGTLLLEDTDLAVTPEQAKELLPLWEMLRSLAGGSTSSQAEVEAVLEQIQGAMTEEQLAAIEEMDQEDMRALFQELGMGPQQGGSQGDDEEEGGFGGPPDAGGGMMLPGGGEGGPGMAPGGGQGGPGMGTGAGGTGTEEQATAMAGRGGMGMGISTGMVEAVIELLESRAAEAS